MSRGEDTNLLLEPPSGWVHRKSKSIMGGIIVVLTICLIVAVINQGQATSFSKPSSVRQGDEDGNSIGDMVRYAGGRLSLTLKNDVRCEGTLQSVNLRDATFELLNTRCFGTEDRPAPIFVPADAPDDIQAFRAIPASSVKAVDLIEPPPAADDE